MHTGGFHDPHPNPYGKKKKSKKPAWFVEKQRKRKRKKFINQKAFLDFMRNPRTTDKQRQKKCKNTIKNYLVNKFKLNLILETNGIDYRYSIRKKKT